MWRRWMRRTKDYNNMRDPARIKPFLERLQTAWMINPDLRFTQLFVNVFQGGDPYYLEDDEAIRRIEKQTKGYLEKR
jgi:hypothetical protein